MGILCLILSSCLIKSSIKTALWVQPLEQKIPHSSKTDKSYTSTNSSCQYNSSEESLLNTAQQAAAPTHLLFMVITGFLAFLGFPVGRRMSCIQQYINLDTSGSHPPIFIQFQKLII